jgi:hypothetical protein
MLLPLKHLGKLLLLVPQGKLPLVLLGKLPLVLLGKLLLTPTMWTGRGMMLII